MQEVILNGRKLKVTNFYNADENGFLKVGFDFQVTSEEYHEITTLLYKNDFQVEIPAEKLRFRAIINRYSTSLTNLYEAGQVGNYSLELIEQG